MSYDTPLTPQGQQLANLPVREQLRRGFKDMGSRSFSSAKNFGLVGAIFAGTECCIEGVTLPCSRYLYCENYTDTNFGSSIGQRMISKMGLLPVVSQEAYLEPRQGHRRQLWDAQVSLLSVRLLILI